MDFTASLTETFHFHVPLGTRYPRLAVTDLPRPQRTDISPSPRRRQSGELSTPPPRTDNAQTLAAVVLPLDQTRDRLAGP